MIRQAWVVFVAAALCGVGGARAAAGLEPGARVTGYSPKHLTGPDKGTKECPPCKYAAGPFIQIFINGESAENTQSLTLKLEAALAAHEKYRGVVVVTDETRKPEMEKWAAEWKLVKTGLCYLPVGIRTSTSREYNVGDAKNVLIVSNAKKVLQSFENAGVADLDKALKLLADATQ